MPLFDDDAPAGSTFPGGMLALGPEYCVYLEKQLMVLFRIMAAEINFGDKFHTVCLLPPSGVGALPAVGLSFWGDFSRARGRGGGPLLVLFATGQATLACSCCSKETLEQGWKLLK